MLIAYNLISPIFSFKCCSSHEKSLVRTRTKKSRASVYHSLYMISIHNSHLLDSVHGLDCKVKRVKNYILLITICSVDYMGMLFSLNVFNTNFPPTVISYTVYGLDCRVKCVKKWVPTQKTISGSLFRPCSDTLVK